MKDPRIEAAARALYEQESRESGSPDPWPSWDSEDNAAREIFRTHATAAIAAIDNASTITTIAELDALPVGSVVLSDGYQYSLTYPNYKVSFQRLYDGEWHRGCRASSTHPENIVPARVIHWGNNA